MNADILSGGEKQYLVFPLEAVPDLPTRHYGHVPMGLHKRKGILNETKDEKKCMLKKVKTFTSLYLTTCHNIFWPNIQTYFYTIYCLTINAHILL